MKRCGLFVTLSLSLVTGALASDNFGIGFAEYSEPSSKPYLKIHTPTKPNKGNGIFVQYFDKDENGKCCIFIKESHLKLLSKSAAVTDDSDKPVFLYEVMNFKPFSKERHIGLALVNVGKVVSPYGLEMTGLINNKRVSVRQCFGGEGVNARINEKNVVAFISI